MNARKINTLKKMRENILRKHIDNYGLLNSVEWTRAAQKDYSRIVEIDRQLKLLTPKP
jgi:hypothetical protein